MKQIKPFNPEFKPKLQCVLCIQYPIQVEQQLVEALINLGSEINVMNPDFMKKLGLQIQKTKIIAQNIESSKLDTFSMVIALFSVKDQEKKSRLFKETFLLADIDIDITLDISYLTLSNVKINIIGCYI